LGRQPEGGTSSYKKLARRLLLFALSGTLLS
jgi:hypothetical protein